MGVERGESYERGPWKDEGEVLTATEQTTTPDTKKSFFTFENEASETLLTTAQPHQRRRAGRAHDHGHVSRRRARKKQTDVKLYSRAMHTRCHSGCAYAR